MPTPRHYSDRPRDDTRWRCHGCGAKNGLDAIRVERDEDYNRLRLRKCRNCKEVLATAEEVISLDQFYARCTRRKEQARAQWQKLKAARRKSAWKQCKQCPGTYHIGHYSKHSLTPEHTKHLKVNRSAHRREIERRSAIKRYWAKRGVDIDTATSNHALMDLNGWDANGERNDRRIARLEDIREDIPA